MSSQQVEQLCEEHAVPAGKIYRAPEMIDDPHFAAREALVKVEHPNFDDLMMQGVAPKMSETPGNVETIGPELGAT